MTVPTDLASAAALTDTADYVSADHTGYTVVVQAEPERAITYAVTHDVSGVCLGAYPSLKLVDAYVARHKVLLEATAELDRPMTSAMALNNDPAEDPQVTIEA